MVAANGLCAVEVLLVVCCRGTGVGAAHVFGQIVGEGCPRVCGGDGEICVWKRMKLGKSFLREEGCVTMS